MAVEREEIIHWFEEHLALVHGDARETISRCEYMNPTLAGGHRCLAEGQKLAGGRTLCAYHTMIAREEADMIRPKLASRRLRVAFHLTQRCELIDGYQACATCYFAGPLQTPKGVQR